MTRSFSSRWMQASLLGGLLLAAPSALAGDTQELDTFILTGPDLVTASTTADFTFRSSLTNRAAEFWCSLDDEPYAPCDSGTWHREGIAPGPHVFWVYAYDSLLGRVDETPANWEWQVEEAPPPLDAGCPDGDAGTGNLDAGAPCDAGTGDLDAGSPVDAGTDAGTGSDAGSPGDTDAGPGPADDGGTTGTDAGVPADDAGTPVEDAGTAQDGGRPDDPVPPGDTTPPDALDYLGSGMGCTGAPAPVAVTGLMLLVLALRRRRGR